MRIGALGSLILAAGVAAVCPGGEPDGAGRPADWPYLRPELAGLMDAVTFHVSFDHGSMVPEMAQGPQWQPSIHGNREENSTGPQFADGLFGKALVLGTGGAVYPRDGNVTLERRGAIAMWVRPENWQRPRDGNTVFAMTAGAGFYLQRQGPMRDDDGRVTRHESVMYLVTQPDRRSATVSGGSEWQNGRWYLLVANWSWPTMELSVNGGPFTVRSLPAAPPEGNFGGLVVGDRGGKPRGLLDELTAFRRPLSLEEVQLLYQLRPEGREE